jgi:hypothetical protein
MVTHDWMVKGTRQKEWIDGKGIFLWLAFAFGGMGGGLYKFLYFSTIFGVCSVLRYSGCPERPAI